MKEKDHLSTQLELNRSLGAGSMRKNNLSDKDAASLRQNSTLDALSKKGKMFEELA